MAEFKEVVQNWHDICSEHSGPYRSHCSECPLSDVCSFIMSKMDEEQASMIEERVMKYAKTAPIYPTILELIHYIANRMPERKDGKIWARDIPLHELVMEHIPDEVAEELGLVPINACGLNKYVEEGEESEWR